MLKASIRFALQIVCVAMKAADVERSDWSAVVMRLGFRCNPPLHDSIRYDRCLCQGRIWQRRIAVLLTKPWMAGFLGEPAYCYLGNLSVSFAVYFPVSLAARERLSKWSSILVALAAVECFELTDGFGIMTNVYDPLDLVANTIGIALAWAVDIAWDRIQGWSPDGT